MDIQKLIDMMNDQSAKQRSETQMTLGELVNALSSIHPDAKIEGISDVCYSYRGYYSDLAFEPGETTAIELFEAASSAIGETFEGYKGGDFTMTKITPLWCSEYGTTGMKIMALEKRDKDLYYVELEEDDEF